MIQCLSADVVGPLDASNSLQKRARRGSASSARADEEEEEDSRMDVSGDDNLLIW